MQEEPIDTLDELVHELRGALDEPGVPRAGDDSLVATMAEKAAVAGTAAGSAGGMSLLAKLGIVGSGACVLVAAIVVAWPGNHEGSEAAAPVEMPSSTSQEQPEVAAVVPESVPRPSPAHAVEEALELGPPPPRAADVKPEPKRKTKNQAKMTIPELTAAELLRQGNEARRNGETDAALRLYDDLTRRYPDSREASTATIARGRLQLRKLDRPADAIESYREYLNRHPNGSLAPEATAGVARGWKALGNSTREREAWGELLDRFPDSIYASQARSRLQLEPAR
jgi:hypothetical protein